MYEENFCIKRIRELMAKNDFNAYRLASKAGISLSTLTSMFQKNTDPRVETIEKISSACGISVSQFFDPDSPALTEEQKKLISIYNRLKPEQKAHAMSYMEFLELNQNK